MMAVIGFLDDLEAVLSEAFRVLVPSGTICIGFIERDEVICEMRLAGFSTIETADRKRRFCVLDAKKVLNRISS